MNIGFSIKSVSDDGVFFLAKDWRKNNVLWMKDTPMLKTFLPLFKTGAGAKRSLSQLLKICPDYANDNFTLVKFENGKVTELDEVKVKAIKVGPFDVRYSTTS